MLKKLAYLGPAGTFSEEAAKAYISLNENMDCIPCANIDLCFRAVANSEVDYAILPVENSCEGSVNLTLDLLAYEYDLKIIAEIIQPIKHSLMTKKDLALPQIECILSHPQALAQCRQYISHNCPDARLIELSSTAEAARIVAESTSPWAAIAPLAAANAYQLISIANTIQDIENNETRFIILSKQDIRPSLNINYKTSLLIRLAHHPGALYDVLKVFAINNINLSKIESRPARTKIGEYMFFIDIEANMVDKNIQAALYNVKNTAKTFRILGSYPIYP